MLSLPQLPLLKRKRQLKPKKLSAAEENNETTQALIVKATMQRRLFLLR
jgi:hypothetical protein